MTPKCRFCGKPLVGKYGYESVRRDLPGGRGYHSVTVRDTKPYGYGYRGSGFFCSLRCGFNYAENHLTEAEFEQTT
jgi:hypothetical protein